MSENDAPEYIRTTLIGRSTFGFESLLGTQAGAYFLDENYINALVEQRSKLLIQANVIFLTTIFLSYLLIVSNRSVGFKINLPLLEIDSLPFTNELFLFVVAILASFHVTRFLNIMMINAMLGSALKRLGYEQVEFVASKWSAGQLWSDMLYYKPYGYKSGFVHIFLSMIICLIVISLHLVQILFVIYAATIGLNEVNNTPNVSSSVVFSYIFYVTIIFSYSAGLLALTLPLKFKWKDLEIT